MQAGYQYYQANTLAHVPGVFSITLPKAISYQELQKHNTSESCWLLIDGHVYDATSVLRWHPAGKEIVLQNAGGRDAT